MPGRRQSVKVTFISNYINHHQIPFCEAFYGKLGADFVFIQTEPMEEERIRMGWAVDVKAYPYVRLFYEEEEVCRSLIRDCDLLLAGWMEDASLIVERLDSGRPAIRISERFTGRDSGRPFRQEGLQPNGRSISATAKNRFICCVQAPMWLPTLP